MIILHGNILAESFGYLWIVVRDGDPRVSAIYRRHYSCYQYADNRRNNTANRNRHLVMGPGGKMILLSADERAIFGWRKCGRTKINRLLILEKMPYLTNN